MANPNPDSIRVSFTLSDTVAFGISSGNRDRQSNAHPNTSADCVARHVTIGRTLANSFTDPIREWCAV